jgi:UDP-2-acetamido-2-deoxy-ribo-hexuluronate aminotransferase
MEFSDLKKQYSLYKQEIDSEIFKVLSNAQFINGPAVKELENQLAEFTGSKYALGCSSGTDAIMLALMALDLKPGDEVIIPDFTFFATAEMVAVLGGVPVFADICPDTYLIDPAKIEEKISRKTVGIITVSIFGQCTDFAEIEKIADRFKLWIIEDGAQSFGASQKGRKSCSFGQISTTSFFPAKPLGCYGDGGAVFTDDIKLADKMRMLLNHGQDKRYSHKYVGINGRLDTMQAAVLKVKLKYFPDELKRRNMIADKYTARLRSSIKVPVIKNINYSAWAQYSLQSENRERILKELEKEKIPYAIHYPLPLHKQEALQQFKERNNTSFMISEKVSNEIFSLPMHPFLSDDEIDFVCETVIKGLK